MTRLVLLDPALPERLDRFRPFLPPGWVLVTSASRAPGDQAAALSGASFAITGDAPVTAAMLATPGLRAVHKWGVGYDGIDLEAARRHGVRVLRTTGANAVAVAETTLGLILAVNRGIVAGHVGIREGGWPKQRVATEARTLSGCSVGIVGMGHIGKALARLLGGFGCTIRYAKRHPLSPAEEAALGAAFAPLEELLANSDVVTLNCDLNDSTRGLIDARRLALMKPDAILVNTARGGVLVEADLAQALRQGRLRGAGIDVLSVEPVTPDNPLLGLDRVVLTPHLAALDAQGFAPSVRRMIANLQAVETGAPPRPEDVLV